METKRCSACLKNLLLEKFRFCRTRSYYISMCKKCVEESRIARMKLRAQGIEPVRKNRASPTQSVVVQDDLDARLRFEELYSRAMDTVQGSISRPEASRIALKMANTQIDYELLLRRLDKLLASPCLSPSV
jgi:hypothetical protein